MSYELIEKARARLAREKGAAVIDRAAPVRFALAFPNVYSVAMASLGYQLVYRMLNDLPDASCERAFLPDPDDLAEHERTRTELFTLESQSPLSEFDVLAFSVSFEMDYLNVMRVLQLAGIPIRRDDRDESRPLIIAGGPCATMNPEAMASFIDAFVLGDAEGVLAELVEALKSTQGQPREQVLSALAQVRGVYVPAFYEPIYECRRFHGMRVSGPAPETVTRAVSPDLSSHPAVSLISTPEAEFGDIDLVEVARGCGRKCRFCLAGHINRPPRQRNISEINGRRLGLVGAAVFDRPDSAEMCSEIVEAGAEFTVSSVRLETVTPQLAALMAAGGQKTLTIAPEAGSDRLRRVINKCSKDDQISAAVGAAQSAGISRVKLYFMLGLPTETDDDVKAIVRLVQNLARQFPSISLQVSASSFVPKPWTPFQWCPMEKESVLKRRFAILKKGLDRIRSVSVSGESPRLATVQGYLSRGDRRIGEVLAAALANGGDYPAAVRESGIDVREYLYSDLSEGDLLPWDHISIGIGKDYLWREYQRSLKEELTAPCDVATCRVCGACEVLDERA